MLISGKPPVKILWFSLTLLFISLLVYTPSSFGFSTHPSTTSSFRIPDKAQAFTGDSITITTRFTNNESISLRGFYYVDHIPEGLTVNTKRVTIDGNDVNYIEETGLVGDIYAGAVPYRWILETPPAFGENNPISPVSVLEIVYSIMSEQEGLFDLHEFHWVGYYQDANVGERSAFGYNKDPNISSLSWVQKPTLTQLSIDGPSSVDENSIAGYTATATFSNDETKLVTMDANWSVIPSLYASISGSGELTTLKVPSNQTVTISTEYTFGDVTATDIINITIVDINTDNDSDGIPDSWEIDYGLDPNAPADALEDLDNDGYNNLEEYKGNTSPQDNSTHPIRPYVLENECYPHDGQGIEADSIRVSSDTSIVIRIWDDEGIDTNSIFMAVQGEDVSAHIRLKQITEGDSTEYWIIYSPLNSFSFDEEVTVILEVEDINGIAMDAYTYSFQVESENEHTEAEENKPLYIVDDHSDPNKYACLADPNSIIVGAMIIYDPNEPIAPGFGSPSEIPELRNGVGLPIALEPPVFFLRPIKIFIPCPGVDDVSILDVFYFNPAAGWIKAGDNDGWMIYGTRIDHNETSPPTIEIQVNYLAAVQAGLSDNANNFLRDSGTSGGCFISTTDINKPLMLYSILADQIM